MALPAGGPHPPGPLGAGGTLDPAAWFRGLVRRLRGAAGPEKGEVWRAAAARLGGTYLPARGRTGGEIRFAEGPWWVRVDTDVESDGTATRIRTRARARYSGRAELRLTVRPRRFWDRWIQGLSGRRPPPVSPTVVERYVVRGEPSARVPSVFSPDLVARLGELPPVRLEAGRGGYLERRRLGERVGRVRCRSEEELTRVETLVGMARLVVETLESLRRVGEADGRPVADDPAAPPPPDPGSRPAGPPARRPGPRDATTG